MDSQSVEVAPLARWKVVTITIVAVLLMAIVASFVVVKVLQAGVKHQFEQIQLDK